MSNEIGQTIAGYEIIALLGRGGMGRVFKVRNVVSNRIEAMKVLLEDAAADPDLAARFLREINVLASLEHPHIAGLRTALQVDNQLFMVMELVEGCSLDEKLRGGRRLHPVYAVDCTCQVLDALSYAHRQGIIHRDIKPGNILLTRAGKVKLTDFGIASRSGDPRLTVWGTTLGSPYYVSPEQVEGAQGDAKSDLYSVGATLYECVTGRRPFEGESISAILRAHIEKRPLRPTEVTPDVPHELSVIIERALEKAPERRFQTAEEFRSALLEIRPALMQAAGGHGLVTAENIPVYAETPTARTGPKPDAPAAASAMKNRGPGKPADSFDESDLEALKKELAVYIGPVARFVVARAAKTSESLHQLYEAVAAEIPSATDRRTFLGSHIVVDSVRESARTAEEQSTVAPAASAAQPSSAGASNARRGAERLSPLPSPPEPFIPSAGAVGELLLQKRSAAPPPSAPSAVPVGWWADIAVQTPPPLEPATPVPPPSQPAAPTPHPEPQRIAAQPQFHIGLKDKNSRAAIWVSVAVAAAVVVLALVWYKWPSKPIPRHQPTPTGQASTPPSNPGPTANLIPTSPEPATSTPPAISHPENPLPARDTAEVPRQVNADQVNADEEVPPAAKVGQLTVTANVTGAKITVDGRSDPSWVTPFTITDLPAGAHNVLISMDGYEDFEQSVSIQAAQTSNVTGTLSPPRGELDVVTDPAGAEVLIDGKSYGPSPVRVTLAPGDHTYVVKSAGMPPYQYSVTLKSGQIISRTVSLNGGVSTGIVEVHTTPPGATVLADGSPMAGQTPASFRLPVGTHKLVITLPGHAPSERQVTVTENTTVQVTVELGP